jgi:hypothetical protein
MRLYRLVLLPLDSTQQLNTGGPWSDTRRDATRSACLQLLCAWRDEHRHRVHSPGRAYGSRGASTHEGRLHDLCLPRGERLRYVEDCGASWAGDSRLEALLPLAPRRVYPVCTGGQRAAPPEDYRGAWGYLEWTGRADGPRHTTARRRP